MDKSTPRSRLRSNAFSWPGLLAAAALMFAAHTPGAAAASHSEAPVYRTTLPPPATLNYRLRKGGWTGNGELVWQPQGKSYQARLEGRVMGIRVMNWLSTGAIDANGIAPARFSDERRGKSPWSADFQRPAGPIVYATRPDQHPLWPGTQDRLTWMVQVAGVANGNPHRVEKGERVSFYITGARGDADVWSFQSKGRDSVTLTSGAVVPAVKLLREPRKPNDTRVEVWLDPARHHLPIRARLTNVQENDTLELLLEE